MSLEQPSTQSGPIAWMAGHSVAANLVMAALIIGGLLFMTTIRQEVFPEFEIDSVIITVSYPGASPEEVESGIILSIEDAIGGIEGVDQINSSAKEDIGMVTVEALRGTDMQRLTQEIQKEVDRITTFPIDAEKPQVTVMANKRQVISMVLFGDTQENVLHELAEQFRDQLLQDPGITQIELEGIKPLEIAIDIPQETLRRYRLSLGDIAQRITAASIDLPGGSVKTGTGEILIRVKERRDYASQFASLPIITTADGSQVKLGDIATIKDGYDESDYYATFNNQPAVMIQVYSVGDQTPIQVSKTVKSYMERIVPELPKGISAEIRRDTSEEYSQRIDLLLRNSAMGLVLVFIMLALFLELRLAFWVMMGIPTAFLGSFLILPSIGVSLNMISLFAFIIALGIVVDDAIIIGENIYHYRQVGFSPMQAAIKGTQEMAMPVTFSILTNIATFMPLLFIPGITGKIFYMIPLVIITVFLLSLAESLFILPYHLGQLTEMKRHGILAFVHRYQQKFSHGFRHWTVNRYGPFLESILKHRYLTIVATFALLVATISYASSGRMGMTLFPKTESDFAQVTLVMPFGTPVARTEAVARHLFESAQKVAGSVPDGDKLLKGVFAEIGTIDHKRTTGSHLASIRAYLAPPEIRDKIMSTELFNQRWREATGEIAGIESIMFESDAGGPGSGSALTIELNHRDIKILEQASQQLADALSAYPIVNDVSSGFTSGKEQLDFSLLPEGRSLGFTAQNVARQVRNAFFGAEVLRQQRGRNEIKIMVRLPEAERMSVQNIKNLMLWSPAGLEIPLTEAVEIDQSRAYTEINRRNGRRNIQVKSGVTPRSRTSEILNDLEATELPRLKNEFPGLQYSFQGSQAEMADSLSSLKISFVFALLGIYAMLAIPFRSYVLPLIVIVSIPFGIIGAIFGHLLMGYELSILSMLGIVALSGIVVNDALVLINYANELRVDSTKSPLQIIKTASIQRLRPILLTTLTTFCGLMPMIFETSRQAKMLIPMAISIGFGIMFATLITLILIPSLYLVVEDIRGLLIRLKKTESSVD
ncbi:MAG: efflux RND transporter permease subunit [Methylicorpusculum sp.]|uniref:efflux RND transporter permease subunit n=1 Tax=Methylicorpusculum sp. TaxID=2713644 RepID=UPI00271D86C1|nr:efflux RND transporter permease subunit [Methylicorpusculum sp.]MDO8843037.1 efflux RND transporter permease subunit [Methylicorpusculum sp.]MDO8938625.1 efflux RND transporter permease subunit [Methylicorpusculum sp.]MDP2203616.1 efflux RND transporter permease subunit [Methylicorpusculum sp.]